MTHAISLFLALAVLWSLLSGESAPLLVGLGIASCALVTLIAVRMDGIDGAQQSLWLRPHRLVAYLAWLTVEIVKSNLIVTRYIISPQARLHPTVIEVDASGMSELLQVVYANSITLTPGTVSINLSGRIRVHVLSREIADDLLQGSMGQRVRELA